MNFLAIGDGRKAKTMKFKAGLDGVTFTSNGQEVLGGFYKAEKEAPRPTAVLLHGLPGIEKHLDIAYELRDRGWNCMYFQFRGCWGSQGTFLLAGLTGDTRGAVEWVRKQPSVGGSTGMYPALLDAAADPGIRAVVGISPLIEPRAFRFPTAVADNFAGMLNGVTGQELQEQWKLLPPLSDSVGALAPRPLLLVTAEKDDIVPRSQYADSIRGLTNLQHIPNQASDHEFSPCRLWLVGTVTDWLAATLGSGNSRTNEHSRYDRGSNRPAHK